MIHRQLIFPAVLSLVFVTLCLAGTFESGKEPTGFRGLEWGSALPKSDMVYLRTDPSYGGVKLYKRPSDKLSIGGAKLSAVIYSYWQGKFCSVRIGCEGYENFAALKEACFAQYGSGYQPNEYIQEYYWFGTVSSVLLEYSRITEKAALWIQSEAISAEQKACEKKKAAESSKDF